MASTVCARVQPLLRSLHAAVRLQRAARRLQRRQRADAEKSGGGAAASEDERGEPNAAAAALALTGPSPAVAAAAAAAAAAPAAPAAAAGHGACTRCRMLARTAGDAATTAQPQSQSQPLWAQRSQPQSQSQSQPQPQSQSQPQSRPLWAQHSQPQSHAPHHLHGAALSLESPFAALSPNLSQLAFCMGRSDWDSAAARDRDRGSGTAAVIAPLAISDYLDDDGFLRFDSFDSLATAAAVGGNVHGGASAAAASSTDCCFSASSSALLSVCALLHGHVRSLSAAEFESRYGQVIALSNHADMIPPLFALFRDGCAGQTVTADPDQGARPPVEQRGGAGLAGGHAGEHAHADLAAAVRDGGSAGVVLMLLSSHIERLLGDIFCARRSDPQSVCPRMLRDLLVCAEVREFLPASCLWLLTALVGSPRSFNLRNILWHGFLPLHCRDTNDKVAPFVSALWLLHLSVLRLCQPLWPTEKKSDAAAESNSAAAAAAAAPDASVGQLSTTATDSLGHTHSAACSSSSLAAAAVPPRRFFRRPLKHKFPGDAALHAHLSSALFDTAADADGSVATLPPDGDDDGGVFPRSSDRWPVPPAAVWSTTPDQWLSLSASVERLMSQSYLLPHGRLHDFVFAWRALPTNPFLSLTVLLPLVEQTCRHLFVYANARLDTDGDGDDDGESDGDAHRPPAANPHIEPGLLLAQSERLFTTLDLVLASHIDPLPDAPDTEPAAAAAVACGSPSPSAESAPLKCGRASAFAFPLVAAPCPYPSAPAVTAEVNTLYRHRHPHLPSVPGSALLLALHELLIARLGPRLRDRVAHGEIRMADAATLPQWLPLYTFNLIIALACKFPIHTALLSAPESFSSPLARSASLFLANYVPVSHARSVTMQRMLAAADGLGAMQQRVAADSSHSLPIEELSMRAPARSWVAFAQRHPQSTTSAKLGVLASECASHAGTGLDAMVVWSSRLALHATSLLKQMRAREPALPLWRLVPAWLLDGAGGTQTSSVVAMDWWTLGADPFWTRSHAAFHHPPPHGAKATPSGDEDELASQCTLSCVLHCHDRCMSHAPVLAVDRALQLQSAVHSAVHSSHSSIQLAADAVAASSSKRRLAEYISNALPAVQACIATTLVALSLLWEQLLAKAHPLPHSLHAAVSTRTASAPAGPSSPLHLDRTPTSEAAAAAGEVTAARSPPPSLLLQRDRSIARLLKQSAAALDRMRALYASNQWILCMREWALILHAIDRWLEAHPKSSRAGSASEEL